MLFDCRVMDLIRTCSFIVPQSKRGVKRKPLYLESLKEVIRAVLESPSIRDAAAGFSISKSTLWNYYKAHQKTESESVSVELGKNDTNLVFTKEPELADYLKTAATLRCGLTKKDCRVLAFQYAEVNEVAFPEQWKVGNAAGKGWMRGLMKRFPA
ncbi:hypothetical protein PR048_029335 [Dryococelus australis]|uniref:HTH psq-type domain-containing protein n=1 Tax=Dryococelus australis TaxID=614101 RepID=A0ABQ9GG23_9NEOP|nr:hypothetical protein PR048_029335 [Dryococelus australis]